MNKDVRIKLIDFLNEALNSDVEIQPLTSDGLSVEYKEKIITICKSYRGSITIGVCDSKIRGVNAIYYRFPIQDTFRVSANKLHSKSKALLKLADKKRVEEKDKRERRFIDNL